jgi:TRAP-type C4-dicarboxylate transport system substrate-binding protein
VGDRVVKDPATTYPGLRVRVSGAWGGKAVTAWGAAPMSIDIGDVPTALERNTINLVHTSWIATQSFKLQETGPHLTLTNMAEVLPGIMINRMSGIPSPTRRRAMEARRFLRERRL